MFAAAVASRYKRRQTPGGRRARSPSRLTVGLTDMWARGTVGSRCQWSGWARAPVWSAGKGRESVQGRQAGGFVLGWGAVKISLALVALLVVVTWPWQLTSAELLPGAGLLPSKVSSPPTPDRQLILPTHTVQSTNHHHGITSSAEASAVLRHRVPCENPCVPSRGCARMRGVVMAGLALSRNSGCRGGPCLLSIAVEWRARLVLARGRRVVVFWGQRKDFR